MNDSDIDNWFWGGYLIGFCMIILIVFRIITL